jgi:ABC-type glycerol-3-phosphate transport system substrate-binding protein
MKRRVTSVVKGAIVAISLLLLALSGVSAKVTTLRWATWGPQKIDTELIEAFERENPDIKIEYIFSSGTGAHHPKMKVLSAGGLAPDVFAVDGVFLAEFVNAGLVAPLDDLIARDNSFSLADYFPASLPDIQYKGRFYGLPYISAPNYMVYNLTHIYESGLPKPDVHWDLATFNEYARKLIRRTDGQVTRWASTSHYLGRTAVHFQPWLWSGGGELFDLENKRFLLTEPAAVNVLDWLAEQRATDRMGSGSFDNQTASITAMYPAGFPSVTGREWPFEWDVTIHPRGAGGQYSIWKGNVMTIAPDSPIKEEAWKFIKFLLVPGETGYSIYLSNKRFPPQTRDRNDWNMFHRAGSDPVSLRDVTLLLASDHSRALPKLVQWTAIMQDNLGQAVVRILSGSVSAKVAMEEIRPAVERLLAAEP